MYKNVIIPYTPRNWQREVYKKLKRFNVLVVHRGAGKSVFAAAVLGRKMLSGPADAEYAYVLPHRNQAERNIWDTLKRLYENVPGVTLNNTTLVLRMPNGSKLHVLGADNPDSLRGLHLHGMVLDEYSEMHVNTWGTVRPMLTNHKGWVIWIGTPKGRNAFFDKYQEATDSANDKNWFGTKMRWQDTGALDEEEIELARQTMAPHEFEQEMECSFNAAITGSYYGEAIDKIHEAGQIGGHVQFNPEYPVHTAWDLGIRDKMSVWFFQKVFNHETLEFDIHLIDYQEESGLGFSDWVTILQTRASTLGYRYHMHYAPHDTRNRELGTGITRLEAAANIGLQFDIVPPHQVMDGIYLVRKHMPQCHFNLERCGQGLEHLRAYRAKVDRNGMALGPLHDEASHCADAFRYLMAGAFAVIPEIQDIDTFGW